MTSGALSDGAHTFTAYAVNNGMESPRATVVNLPIDSTPPTKPIILAPTAGAVMDTRTPAITGTTEANATITINIDSVNIGAANADSSGNWSFAVTAPLSFAEHTLVATASDAAGTASASDSIALTVLAPPVANPVSTTIAANSPSAPITLNLGDGRGAGNIPGPRDCSYGAANGWQLNLGGQRNVDGNGQRSVSAKLGITGKF